MKRYMILGLIALVSLSQTTFAQVFTWAGGHSGNAWNDANNWSPKGVPETGDSAIVMAPPYEGPIINEGNVLCYELNGPGDSKGANLMQITGGTVHFEDRWRIPKTYGCGPGIVEISGGTISIGRYWFIGYRGSAVVTTTDGVGIFNVGTDIDMGRDWEDESNHGNGTWNLEGGTFILGTKMRVGNHGEAVLNMSGGSISIPNHLRIGDTATGHGEVNLSGGTLNINDGDNPEGLIVGRSGTGYLNMTGGTINVGREFSTSFEAGSYSEVVIDDGYISTARYLCVGEGGDSTFIMNGGEIVLGEHLTVGDTGTGYFEINGGTILCGSPDTVNLRINKNSSMNIAGGTLIIRGYAVDYVEELVNSSRLLAYDARGWINTDYNELEDQTIVTAGGGQENTGVIAPRPGAYGIDFHGAVLQWIPGSKAAECVLYFGGDYDLVAAGDASVYMGTFAADVNSYNLNDLALDTTYYWRVDSYKDGDPNSPWTGNVWPFTTRSNVLDDFESYNDLDPTDPNSNRIFNTWIDGLDVPTNGSIIGYDNPPFAEQTIVHSGNQSMPFFYDNSGSHTLSEAERTWVTPQNWTLYGGDSMRLYFRGDPIDFLERADGSIVMSGGGADIWGTADQCRFAFKQLTGNGSIVARIDSIVRTHSSAKAGVMIRQDLEAGSRFATVVVTPDTGLSFRWRRYSNEICDDVPRQTGQTPVWVKLTRTGDVFTAEYSADGVTWQDFKDAEDAAFSIKIPMMENINIGLVVNSRNVDALTTAEFSNVSTTGNVTGQWQVEAIGVAQASNDPEPFYVAVEDSTGKVKVVTHPNPEATNLPTWQEWSIPLSEFSGVNMTRVRTMYIGIGDRANPTPDGSGRLYIDDIELSRTN